jgi:transcriptional regulator with XRE-family HTH domain
MASIRRVVARARRIAESDRVHAGMELHQARVSAGLSLRAVAEACGISPSQLSRMERGRLGSVSAEQLAVAGSVVGLDVRTRIYPAGDPLRDAGQVRLLGRLRSLLPATVRLVSERPVASHGDLRAWDGTILGLDGQGAYPSYLDVEGETRITDLQAQTRRIALKARDAGAAYVLVVVADTTANRRAVLGASASILADFPIPAREALAALRAGRHPGGSALVFL